MIKHIILWKLKEDVDKNKVKQEIKQGLEGLVGVVPGLITCKVITEGLETSTADLMLDTSFNTQEDFNVYKNHPAHLEVANGKVRPNVEIRMAYDFEVKE